MTIRKLLANRLEQLTGWLALVGLGSILSCQQHPVEQVAPSAGPALANWFRQDDFAAATFQRPPLEFGPFTRWWWPGNDVTSSELQREVRLLAANRFAGVEIQPFSIGVGNLVGMAHPGAKVPQARIDRVNSWDTPSFYEHVRAVLTQARACGLTVDMAAGSGWPLGGPSVGVQQGMLDLACSDTLVRGGQTARLPVPKRLPDHTALRLMGVLPLYGSVDPGLAKLQAVLAVRRVSKVGPQIQLDSTSVVNITRYVKDGLITWPAPAGASWELLAFWAVPSGELPGLVASRKLGFVVDHLDSTKMAAVYEHLFGARSGLLAYAGRPLRAVFNDSYELKPDRHYTPGFLAYFRQHRGYDATPWLPANMQPGYNVAYDFLFPGARPRFVFSREDWRLRYDYDLTVSDLVREQLVQGSNHWLSRHGLAHRTQAYGVKMDIIAASGAATLPETEQLWGGGSEGFLKLVTSGAHLYNRPTISCESLVFPDRSEMTTPQKIKIAADKAFAAGVTQLVYHGTPYRYQAPEFGPEGWKVFAPFVASNLNEQAAFWSDIKQVNTYVARAQYALRTGKPRADVLIYFPFVDLADGGVTPNPAETLVNGYLPGVEPAPPAARPPAPTPTREWFARIWPLLNQLQAAGLTWDYVNDASLQAAQMQDRKITVRGNRYEAVVLAYAPYIQLASARRLQELAGQGGRLLLVGAPPAKQPSFLHYQRNDELTQRCLALAAQAPTSTTLPSASGAAQWARRLPSRVAFSSSYPFLRQMQREMTDGSRLHFLWNQSAQWQTVRLRADHSYRRTYWLRAEDGTVVPAAGDTLRYALPPYGSVFLYLRPGPAALGPALLSAPPLPAQEAPELLRLAKWHLTAGPASVAGSPLFDWRTNPAFTHLAATGVYTTAFTLPRKDLAAHYVLDLGTVYFTAEVRLNGQPAGKRIFAPYQVEVTRLIKPGINQLEVRVAPTQRNAFVLAGTLGDPRYQLYKGRESSLMPAGLLGPVSLKQVAAAR